MNTNEFVAFLIAIISIFIAAIQWISRSAGKIKDLKMTEFKENFIIERDNKLQTIAKDLDIKTETIAKDLDIKTEKTNIRMEGKIDKVLDMTIQNNKDTALLQQSINFIREQCPECIKNKKV
jgi:hypothetical protein